jgi:hypothetical protein
MTCTIDIQPKHRLSATLVVGLALSACLVLGAVATPASAEIRRETGHGGHDHGNRGYGDRGGGYYAAPPVVYGSPYAYAPPVVYGPGIGINAPGISIDIN